MQPQQPNIPGGQPFPPQQPMYPTPMQGPLAPAPSGAGMPKHHSSMGLIIGLVVSILFFFGALGFGIWAFMGMQDYKNNSDQKAAATATKAVEENTAKLNKEFDEKYKSPYTTYTGPASFGTLTVTYPKTWSAYITEGVSNIPVDGYLHPGFVPGVQTQGIAYALRFQVVSSTYANELKKFEGNAKSGKVKITPYKLPKVPDITGSRIDGQIAPNQTGSTILLPLRDKTVVLSTQAPQFIADFDKIILPNVTFLP